MHRTTILSLLLCACAAEQDPATPATCTSETRAFAIDSIELPRSVEGDLGGLDLDDDGAADNAGGRLLDTLFHVYEAEQAEQAWSAQLEARLAGDLTWIVELPACGAGAIRLRDDVAPLGALADVLGGAPVAWHPIHDLRADLAVEDTSVRGTIGFGLAPPYREVIGEAFLDWINALLVAGDTLWGRSLDADGDGAITYAELDADPLFDWFMRPDLGDSISFAIEIRATEVSSE